MEFIKQLIGIGAVGLCLVAAGDIMWDQGWEISAVVCAGIGAVFVLCMLGMLAVDLGSAVTLRMKTKGVTKDDEPKETPAPPTTPAESEAAGDGAV